MDLPICHGQHSSNKQIQMKRICYWDVWQSITQIWEQQWGNMGPYCGKWNDLLALLPESLYSSQHHVVLPNEASQQCCTVEHKTNLLPRLITMQAWFSWGEDPSGIQNKTFKEPSVPEGFIVHKGTVVATATQQSPNHGPSCISMVGFCSQFISSVASKILYRARVPVIATSVLHNNSCYFSFVIFIPRIPVVCLKYPLIIIGSIRWGVLRKWLRPHVSSRKSDLKEKINLKKYQ